MSSTTSRPRSGFSLLEVMVALSILGVGMAVVSANWATLFSMRRSVGDQQQALAALSTVAERIASADWAGLGTDAAPWSRGRYFDRDGSTTIGLPPLSENPSNQREHLRAQGLLAMGTGLNNLKIYVEYYRAVSQGASAGVLTPATADVNSAAFRTRIASRSNRNDMRLDSATPTAAVGEDDPVFVRLLATWTAAPVMADPEEDRRDSDNDGRPDAALSAEFLLARRR